MSDAETGNGLADDDGPADPAHPPTLHVVGLGGSAGNAEPLRQFFSAVDPGIDAAFVVVVHLSPSHDSALAEILQRCTTMPVKQVRTREKLESGHVYVIAPGMLLTSLDGHVAVETVSDIRRRQGSVDVFFRTLADTHGTFASAVVLSGSDGDGAIGLKRIKERGGLTIAQDPAEVEASGMPRAAIGTGMVDWVLTVKEMASHLAEYIDRGRRIRLSDADTSMPPPRQPENESVLRDLLSFLRGRTGRDFSHYKRATLLRRIVRRMQANAAEDLPSYLECLRTRPGEAGALLQDLLISVTNFFRDPKCFDALAAQIPSLFQDRSPADTIRIWVPACATGEEAYSIAMLLSEHARTLEAPPAFQIFATDLSEDAIRTAREGLYPTTIEVDVSDERLRRYFLKEHYGYRVRRELRETVLFAVHDILKDSPFSRISLIACRNLLIYLAREAQERVFETFHFSLLRDGLLFLGSSESLDDHSSLFSIVDKKNRIYRHRPTHRAGLPVPTGPGSLSIALDAQVGGHRVPVLPNWPATPMPALAARDQGPKAGRTLPWGDVHLRILEQLAPPSILVDENHEILHLSPSASRLLQYQGGEPTHDLLKAIHPALRIPLRAALFQVTQGGESIDVEPVVLEVNGQSVRVSARVTSAGTVAKGLSLVLLRMIDSPSVGEPMGESAGTADDPLARQLDRELERMKSYLRDTVEQYEASNEELKASNEELQAMNEELRSATEELETSREELKSINEELTTVNHELKSKVDELGHANSDMHNLMDATAIATIFLDRDLRVTRFTPSAVRLFSLIPSDIGRPLSDLTTHLDYGDLGADAARVLERLVPIEREVGENNGRWYQARVLPYRTLDDRIAGVVLTFVDVSDRKRALEALRVSRERFSAMVSQAPVGVCEVDAGGRITLVNDYFCTALGTTADRLIQTPLLGRAHGEDRGRLDRAIRALFDADQSFQLELRATRDDGAIRWMQVSGIALGQDGVSRSALMVCSDITDRLETERALRETDERLRLIVENAREYAILALDLQRHILVWSPGAERLFGYAANEALGQPVDLLFTDEDRAAGVPATEAQAAIVNGRASDDRLLQRRDGSRFWANGAMMTMRDAGGEVVGFVKILRDQTETREMHAMLEVANGDKERFLALLSHELRNPLASVMSAAEALQLAGSSSADQHHAAEIVGRQAAMMKVLLDDLLDISRLRMGRLKIERRAFALQSLVDDAVETVRPMLAEAAHELTVDAPAEPVFVDVDPARMVQVITNLLTNATKYTPEGGRIRVTIAPGDRRVELHVEDNGVGMEPDSIEAMFELFAHTPEHRMSGLGIGLAVVRGIVRLHGGSVHAQSPGPGQGSTFIVELPTVDPPDHPASDDASVLASTKETVLLADDNPDVIWPLAQLLRRAGCTVWTADGGQQALKLAQAHHPGVVVLDIGMPDLSGYDVATRIRALPGGRQILLVAVTGWGQDADRRKAIVAGFDAHLVKPILVEDLLRLMESHAKGDAEDGDDPRSR